MIDETLFEAEEKMEKAVQVAREVLQGLRSGRATPVGGRGGGNGNVHARTHSTPPMGGAPHSHRAPHARPVLTGAAISQLSRLARSTITGALGGAGE